MWMSLVWVFSEVLGLNMYLFIYSLCGCCCELQMWPDLIQKAKDGGLDVIQTYVFWNGHEPSPGKVNADYIFCSAITFDCIGCLVAEKG